MSQLYTSQNPCLVLSCFPGIDLLGRAFEEVWGDSICIVRGPDLLWGGRIELFHPPVGKFSGVIGGPPCQCFSRLKTLNPLAGKRTPNLIPEFCRCVIEASPEWFLMENVREAEEPIAPGWAVARYDVCDNEVGGITQRRRRFWFGSRSALCLSIDRVPGILFPERAVTRNVRIPKARHFAKARARGGGVLPGDGEYASISRVCELQGLPGSFPDRGPFRRESLRLMLGNGVPLPMGRAVAKAIKRALGSKERLEAS